MVRTFPESGFVVGAVGGAIGKDRPEPLAVGAVEEMRLDESKGIFRHLPLMRVTDILVLIHVTDYSLGIAPPLRLFEDAISCSDSEATANGKGLLQ